LGLRIADFGIEELRILDCRLEIVEVRNFRFET
jgi:hypothetical protein